MKFSKDVKDRMIKTFIQTLLGYIVVNIAIVDFTNEKEVVLNSILGIIIGAVASGLCALMNLENNKEMEINDNNFKNENGDEVDEL